MQLQRTLEMRVIELVMFKLPLVFQEILAPALAPDVRNNAGLVFGSLRTAIDAYCVLCTQHVVICGAIIQ